MHTVFLVLHYKTLEVTIACIESLRSLERPEEIGICVVDNASGNGSGEELMRRYGSDPNIKVLLRTENDGFSRGNNAGFSEIKKHWDPKFLVVTNNDTVFPQKDLLDRIDAVYARTNFAVFGPDILKVATGEHQSPIRRAPMSLAELDRTLSASEETLKKLSLLAFVKQTKDVLIPRSVNEAIKQRVHKKNHGDFDSAKTYTGVVLFGACQIFSKAYFEGREKLYTPETFFYYEEDILIHRCLEQGLMVVYDPEVLVHHLESASTKAAFKKVKDGMAFKHQNLLKGGRIYRTVLTGEANEE